MRESKQFENLLFDDGKPLALDIEISMPRKKSVRGWNVMGTGDNKKSRALDIALMWKWGGHVKT